MTLGAESLLPDDNAIVSTNSTGALEWVLVNRGPDSDVVTLKV